MMFKLLKDFNENGIDLKKGTYSKDQLIKLYGDEGAFNFCFTCTSLKEYLLEVKQKDKSMLEKILDVVSEPLVKDIILETEKVEDDKVDIVYIVKEEIRKGKKVIFSKDDKITFLQLEEAFGDKVNEIFEKDLLIETKISNAAI